MQGVLVTGVLAALDAAALLASFTASYRYVRYATQFSNDCGRVVSMPLSMALVMWLAVAASAASGMLAAVLYRWLRSRDTGQGVVRVVRVLCFLLCGAGILAAALCVIAVLQFQPYTVICSGP